MVVVVGVVVVVVVVGIVVTGAEGVGEGFFLDPFGAGLKPAPAHATPSDSSPTMKEISSARAPLKVPFFIP
jgi:hypothetical protein